MTDPFDSSLRTWFSRNGVRWAGLQFQAAAGRGVFGIAQCDLQMGSTVLIVPKAAMLTRKNAAAAEELHGLLELGLPSVEVLGLAVALERKAGRSSRWYPYLKSIPHVEPLPLMWTVSEQRLLAGTGLDAVSQRRRQRLVDNYRAAEAEWAGPSPLPSLEEYLQVLQKLHPSCCTPSTVT